MHPAEIDKALESAVLIVDSREKPTRQFKDRLKTIGLPHEQYKLCCGDYSIKCDTITLENKVVIERKMNLDELAMCFGRERKRFEAEFERAKENGIRIYLLCEGSSWSRLYNEQAYKIYCKSKYPAKALIASLLAWQVRYDMVVVLCDVEESPLLIRDILRRELKEHLENEL